MIFDPKVVNFSHTFDILYAKTLVDENLLKLYQRIKILEERDFKGKKWWNFVFFSRTKIFMFGFLNFKFFPTHLAILLKAKPTIITTTSLISIRIV